MLNAKNQHSIKVKLSLTKNQSEVLNELTKIEDRSVDDLVSQMVVSMLFSEVDDAIEPPDKNRDRLFALLKQDDFED